MALAVAKALFQLQAIWYKLILNIYRSTYVLEERGACNWGLRLPPNLRKLVFSSVEVKKRQTDNRGDCQSVAVLRAGVEPAQVSLSVFETDASTDSAIGALGVHWVAVCGCKDTRIFETDQTFRREILLSFGKVAVFCISRAIVLLILRSFRIFA